MALRAVRWDRDQQNSRDQRAARWRDQRARLFALPDAQRRQVRNLWPDPSYLGDLLDEIAIGELDPNQPPWVFHRTVRAKTTPNPRTFDEAFRQIGGRKVGGGPKTTSADELIFCGNLGSSFLILVSRVRLIDPNESFYTSSNHRLRDSHVGRAGHWVDIEVRGDCSVAQIALIERLARAADARPVVVRRSVPPRTGATR